jgi:hypothetical protein
VVVPVVSAYAVLICVVLYAARHSETDAPVGRSVGWRGRMRLIFITVAGGYGCFLAIVYVFHVLVAGQRAAMSSALRGGAFLAVTSAAAFLFGSIVESIRR